MKKTILVASLMLILAASPALAQMMSGGHMDAGQPNEATERSNWRTIL